MRPAILIIIMDFLVSSLLLFITGPDNWQMTAGAGGRATAAPEFAPAAIAAMEAGWMRESQDALISRKLLVQEKTIALLSHKSSELESAKSGLETSLAAQRQELQTRQKELEDKARQEEALRQEQQQLAAAIKEREKMIISQQESIASLAKNNRALEEIHRKQEQEQRTLKDIQADQKTINTNLLALNTNLAVIQQQGTVTQARLTDLAERQTLMNERLGDLQIAQARMDTTLQSVNTLAATLPDVLRAGFQEISENQQQLDATVSSLAESVPQLNAVGTPAEFKGFDDKLNALAAQHKTLQSALQTVVTGRADQLASGIAAVRQNQYALESQLQGLAAKVEDVGAKRPGPFRPFRDARVELRVSMTEEYPESLISGRRMNVHAGVLYPPLLSSAGGLWVVAGYKDLGLNWSGISSDLKYLYFRLARRDGTGFSALIKSPLRALTNNPRVVLIGFSATNDPQLAAAGITNTAPMKILGRPALEKRGTGGIFLFKRSSEGLSFALDASFDMTDPRYLVVRRNARAWASAVKNAFTNPNYRPEAGDFVVTEEGGFIGLMVDDQRCLILDESPLAAGASTIPLDAIPAFVDGIKQLRRAMK